MENTQRSLKIYLSQSNFIVGDIDGNCHKILQEYSKAVEQQNDLIIFSEMAICGYPCEDLWLKPHFIEKCQEKIKEILEHTKKHETAILLGCPYNEIERKKTILRNSAIFMHQGEIKKIFSKKSLPNYGVFDENRYFKASNYLSLLEFKNYDIAVIICEDLWDERNLLLLNEQVFDAIISINASPFNQDKHLLRLDLANKYAKSLSKPLIYVNQIGGQDSLVFDGSSFAIESNGNKILQMANFTEDSAQIMLDENNEIVVLDHQKKHLEFSENFIEQAYNSCVLGLRDYIEKNNFSKVLLGMSGGIDSAVVATIAVDALGSERVSLFALPTKFNSASSLHDAIECSKNLNIDLKIIEIENIFQTFLQDIQKSTDISAIAEENLQSRIRGNILMAISNSTNSLLLSTGNKSEMACGYATLYGDMNGAFNPIKDLYKTQIYEFAKFRNENNCKISEFKKINLIPQNIINKAPSAELRFNQKDSDSLPDYAILDKILFNLIEQQKSIEETINDGFDKDLVKKVAKLIHNSEYKRKQAVLGVKISKLSFDKERRYPLTNKFIF